ncbi:MAG: ankyrin repeat domain-containing protein, partial [Chitinophagaceae bacterium]|nr:ankyrin repeat domain-containing protein [Chitinophagaceae bacterium]
LLHHADIYPIDTSLIFVSGASAGGVTSLFLAYLTQNEWDQLAPPLHTALGAIDRSGNELTDKFRIRGVINLWGGINDTSFISPQEMQAMPVLLFHSVDDEGIPYERSSHPEAKEQLLHGSFDVAHRFKNNNACYKLYFVKGAKHGYGFSQNYVIKGINDFVNDISKGKCKSDEIENKNVELNLGFGEYIDTWDKDQSKWTLLMKHAYKDDTSTINSLLIGGQNINSKNAEGWTALKVAVIKGEIKTVKYLLQHKADPNLADREGLNSLMEACIHNHYDIATMLLENGADPNLTNIYGWTALMGATVHGDINLIELLLKYKADINARRKTDGMTALGLAKFIKDNQKIELLTSYGAK